MNKLKSTMLGLVLGLLLVGRASAQTIVSPPNSNPQAPSVSFPATTLTLTYTAGTIYPGVVSQAITGSTLTLTNTENTCTAASIQAATDACNYVYWTTGASLSTTTTYATAAAPGNLLLYLCTTTGGNITACTPAALILPVTSAGSIAGTGQTGAVTVPAGRVGQVISNIVAVGAGTSITTATPVSVLSVSLTAGDWDVSAAVNYSGTGTTIAAASAYEISITSGTSCSTPAHTTDGSEIWINPPVVTTTAAKFGGVIPMKQFNLSATTTVCAIATGTFTAGTEVGYGLLIARRRD